MNLGGPAAVGWVALVGTTELRELRGRIPWYGTVANHAGVVLPAVIAGVSGDARAGSATGSTVDWSPRSWAALPSYGELDHDVGRGDAADSSATPGVFAADVRGVATNLVALAPLSWLMAQVYEVAGWWATSAVRPAPVDYRVAYHRFVETREMFTQTVASLAQAVDARDRFTSGHSQRVMQIAVDIGREMRLSAAEMEALEWGGLLHDVGKIGVPDDILLKQDRLSRDERMKMNAHPVIGANIIAPVTKLAPELPIIRHHHEWYNGSGYPDRLIGDEIPKLARVLHVADAFEAMTAQRPYRMKPLTYEQAVSELRKFAGVQFDPIVVDSFVKTHWADGVADPGRYVAPRPVPLITQAAGRLTQATAIGETASATTELS